MKIFFSQKAFQQAVLQNLPKIAPNRFLFPLNGPVGGAIQSDWANREYQDNFVDSADIYSIITYIADKIAALPLYVYAKDKKGKRTVIEEGDPLVELIANPNKSLTQREFIWVVSVLYLACGEVFLYKYGTLNGKAIAMHIFTAADTAITVSGDFPYEIISYEFSYGGRKVLEAQAKDVIHIKKPSTIFGFNGEHLRGMSPLRPGRKIVEGLDLTEQRQNAVIRNGGVPGIIYNEGMEGNELDVDAYNKWKASYIGWHENMDAKGVPMPSSGKLGYIQTGLNAVDMGLKEAQSMTFKKACNLFHISELLFNAPERGTFNNLSEMRKAAYTDAIIPVADAIRDALNKGLVADNRKVVDFDYSEVPELQEDMLKKMQAIAAAPVAPSLNEIREMFGYERFEDDNADTPLLKSGYTFFDDQVTLPPIDPLNTQP